jgi:hypothetical protein
VVACESLRGTIARSSCPPRTSSSDPQRDRSFTDMLRLRDRRDPDASDGLFERADEACDELRDLRASPTAASSSATCNSASSSSRCLLEFIPGDSEVSLSLASV